MEGGLPATLRNLEVVGAVDPVLEDGREELSSNIIILICMKALKGTNELKGVCVWI